MLFFIMAGQYFVGATSMRVFRSADPSANDSPDLAEQVGAKCRNKRSVSACHHRVTANWTSSVSGATLDNAPSTPTTPARMRVLPVLLYHPQFWLGVLEQVVFCCRAGQRQAHSNTHTEHHQAESDPVFSSLRMAFTPPPAAGDALRCGPELRRAITR